MTCRSRRMYIRERVGMTRNEIKTERATEADCDEIACIEKICFSDPWPREIISAQISGKSKIMLTAKKNGRIAGYIAVMHVEDEGYISNLAVLPEFRRSGAAGALVAAVTETSKKIGLSFLSLEVRASNAAARALYEKFGFTKAGLRRNYYETPKEDAIIMTLFL